MTIKFPLGGSAFKKPNTGINFASGEFIVPNRIEYFDSPPGKEWFLQFKCLFLPTDHRKILNRQPEVMYFSFINGLRVTAFIINRKVISN